MNLMVFKGWYARDKLVWRVCVTSVHLSRHCFGGKYQHSPFRQPNHMPALSISRSRSQHTAPQHISDCTQHILDTERVSLCNFEMTITSITTVKTGPTV